ncbi:MAG: DNA alkylation repair protein [Chloroflexota bacterium]|nr:MAG: DNA alkylation repair protein [Chloroflexota bacterium]
MTEEPFTLKESLFNQDSVAGFAVAIKGVYPAFDEEAFLGGVFDESWPDRALMDRMRHVTTVLHDGLPAGYRQAAALLIEASPNLAGGGFIDMVPCDYAAVYGLDDLETSIPLLEESTKLTSAEFAVRPFIEKYPDRMMAQMLAWADHEHEGVRRLASEGCRPRLPWGIRLHALIDDPAPILPILEKLKHDPSESVRRSVANNLNDISKDNPDAVLDLLRRWNAAEADDKEISWITGHALRTLVKAGDVEALELLGYPADPQIVIRDVRVEPGRLAIGEFVTLCYELESTGEADQKLMVDYVVYLMRANGRQTAKVFKHKKITIKPGQVLHLKKKQSFRPVTTRKYYPGTQAIAPQINGRLFERVEFELIA